MDQRRNGRGLLCPTMITAAVHGRAARARGFLVLDGATWVTPFALLLGLWSILIFGALRQERAADATHAELVSIADQCLIGWEATIGRLNRTTDALDQTSHAFDSHLAVCAFHACACWAPEAP